MGNLKVESLENRNMMAGITLNAGVLTITGTNAADEVIVDATVNGVVARLNDVVQVFAPMSVTSLVVNGLAGDDKISNNTGFSATLRGGAGDDTIKGGTGNDVMQGGAGDDILTDFAGGGGTNVLDGEAGNDSLWGGFGPSDTLLGGNGNDVIYDIVGGTNVIIGGAGSDTLISRATDVVLSNRADTVVSFGAGQGPVSLVGGILYLMGDGNDNTTVVESSRNEVTVTADGQVFTFPRSQVKMLAGIGGAGNDRFVNNTAIDSVYYGLSGDDTLIGGTGSDLLKGGQGNDTLLGRGGADDLSGDDGSDILSPGGGRDIVRADILDILVGVNVQDRLVKPRTYQTAYV